MRSSIAAVIAVALAPLFAQTPCHCDPSKPETMKQRQCSLCNEAEKQPENIEVFFLKDINPHKPNRTLALPRAHGGGHHALSEMTPEARTRFWTAAIERAKSIWGGDWAVAYNGDRVRTQCHAHVHLGKLLPGVEEDNFVIVNSIAEIPVPDGTAMWIHPVDGKLHVHTGGQIAETVLLR
jgi:diadenosine tetraphosphate (Ap4A) HIT family hydrolase